MAHKVVGGGDAVSDGQRVLGVDHLAPAIDLPMTVLRAFVPDSDVSAGFEAVGDAAGVLAVVEVLAEAAVGAAGDLPERQGFGRADGVDGVSELGILRCAVGVDYLPKRLGLRRRRLRIEVAEIDIGEKIVGDVFGAAFGIPVI